MLVWSDPDDHHILVSIRKHNTEHMRLARIMLLVGLGSLKAHFEGQNSKAKTVLAHVFLTFFTELQRVAAARPDFVVSKTFR